MQDYEIHPDFETLHVENGMLRAELAALHEEYEHINRFLIPSTKTAYLIQIGALRVDLLQSQTAVRKIRRKIAILRENIAAHKYSDTDEIEQTLTEEFRQWDERLRYELSEIESAKARFSSLCPNEDMEEIRSIYRMLSRKLNPEVNDEQSDEAKSFWPSVQTAYVWNDLFQLKALLMMSEDYPESYELPNDIGSMRRTHATLKEKVERARSKIRSARQHPAFEWRKLLDAPEELTREQSRLREEIAKARIQKTALEDMLRSLELKNAHGA
ncbi:hypothetical protein LJC31_02605 [Synergistaceae bacterium OttesenSCG-928-I11]|nr:hypothetical protein [Synergistaceae bacterium OttesenSCG-928-I11]